MFFLFCFLIVLEVLSECCLLSYMARVENRLSFLFRLINIINVQTLTQVWFHCHLDSQVLFEKLRPLQNKEFLVSQT